MARLLSSSLCAAAAVLVTVACTSKVGPPAAASGPTGDRLIPAEATVLAGVDVGRLVESEVFGLFRAELTRNVPELGWLDTAGECGRPPADAHLQLIVGGDGRDEFMVIALGDGIGDGTFLRCLADKRARDGQPPFTIVDPAAPALTDARVVATIVDPRTVAFTTRPWTHHVADRLAGRGVAALDGPMQPQFDRADRNATFWFVGRVPEDLARVFEQATGAPFKDMLGSVDLSGGVRLDLVGGVVSPEKAAALGKLAQDNLSMFKGMLPMFGVGGKTADTLRLEVTGAELRLTFAMPLDEVLSVTKRLAPMLPPPVDPQVQTARSMLTMIGDAYATFRVNKPEGCPNAAELKAAGVLDAMPVDPWGGQFSVICPGKHGPIDIASPGPDGRLDTADDIKNWP